MAAKTSLEQDEKKGGQFAPESGGQFAPESGGQFGAEKGGQFKRKIQGFPR